MTTTVALEMVLELARELASSQVELEACDIVEDLLTNRWEDIAEYFAEYDISSTYRQ